VSNQSCSADDQRHSATTCSMSKHNSVTCELPFTVGQPGRYRNRLINQIHCKETDDLYSAMDGKKEL